MKMLPNLKTYKDNIEQRMETFLKDKHTCSKITNRKSSYRHIPHCLKPPHLVAKRNARERRRVQAVNSAFLKLRKYVPYEPQHKRLSKVKTLQFAIDYIHSLQDLITDHDEKVGILQTTLNTSPYYSDNYTNYDQVTWTAQLSNPQSYNTSSGGGGIHHNHNHHVTDVLDLDPYSRLISH